MSTSQNQLVDALLDLIRTASVEPSADVYRALLRAHEQENWGTRSKAALGLILENLLVAHREQLPFTSHTSSVSFYVRTPADFDRAVFEESGREAVVRATKQGWIQPNLVDPVTGKVIKSNAGPGMPQFDYELDNRATLEVRVVLKGNGAEGAGMQFVLPDESIGATNDLAGVRRAVLEALIQNQGRGCGPGVIGIGIGGDRASGMVLANRQLLRAVDDSNSVKALDKLERQLLEEANSLGIGPLGFGGKSTLLGVKIGAEASPVDSCYVSLSYNGWAYRRQGVELTPTGEVTSWLYPRLDDGEWVDPSTLKPPPPSERKAEPATATQRRVRPTVTLPLLGRLEDFDFDEDDLFAPPAPIARAQSTPKPRKKSKKTKKGKKKVAGTAPQPDPAGDSAEAAAATPAEKPAPSAAKSKKKPAAKGTDKKPAAPKAAPKPSAKQVTKAAKKKAKTKTGAKKVAKQAAAKKTPAKKSTPKKSSAKKTPAKKATPKKTPAKKKTKAKTGTKGKGKKS